MASQGVEYAYDDVTNANVDAKLVREARELEMQIFKDLGVYVRVPRASQRNCNGKIIKTRWVGTNKGDATKPNYRSQGVPNPCGRRFALLDSAS